MKNPLDSLYLKLCDLKRPLYMRIFLYFILYLPALQRLLQCLLLYLKVTAHARTLHLTVLEHGTTGSIVFLSFISSSFFHLSV